MKFRLLMLVICMPASWLWSGQPVELHFNDLATVIANSPGARMAKHDLQIHQHEIAQELKWFNPELELEREQLSEQGIEDREMLIAVSKEITLPWTGSRHKAVKNGQRNLALTEYELDQLFLLHKAKIQYVSLALLQEKLQHLDKARDRILRVSQISADRFEQGALSGLEHRMLELELANLSAHFVDLETLRAEQFVTFKILVGVSQSQTVQLRSELTSGSVDLHPLESYLMASEHHPDMVRLEQQLDLHRQELSLAKSRIVPSVNLFGGYKQANNADGFVAGISLPLPLFDRNENSVQKQSLQIQRHLILKDQQSQLVKGRIEFLFNTCQKNLDFLQAHARVLENTESVLNDLIFSFEKGWVSFADMFSGIQVYINGLDMQYSRLQELYESAIFLETLTLKQTLDIDE